MSSLRMAAPNIQAETAWCWFRKNLKPYDLTARPYLGLVGSLDALDITADTPFPPVLLDAAAVINVEFSGALNGDVKQVVIDSLSGDWMWLDNSQDTLPANARKAILRELSTLADLFQQAAPPHGQMGHNGPPDDFPLTQEERDEALAAIEVIKTTIESDNSEDFEAVKPRWARVVEISNKVGLWALDQMRQFGKWAGGHIDTFAGGVAGEGGKAVGKELPRLIAVGIGIWLCGSHTEALIVGYLGFSIASGHLSKN